MKGPIVTSRFRALSIDRDGPVATVRIHPVQASFNLQPPPEVHQEVGLAMSRLRDDDEVLLVVLTGSEDGEFVVPPPTEQYRSGGQGARLNADQTEWLRGTGVIRAHQAMAEMEKPIIARVNGDAFGFGSSLMLNCDLIVAREDALISDMHLGLGTLMTSSGTGPVGPQFSMYPGDGGISLAPLYMTPARAKEYLMLATPYTARQMADLGWINYAVPFGKLDEKVDDLSKQLLARAPDVIAYTKRVANRLLVEQLNRTLDAGVAYEHISIRQWLAGNRS
jgi:enoyl-CoA hydratase